MRFDTELFQAARLSDIWLLGPFMIWFAVGTSDMPDWARWTLGLSGAATVVFNAANYEAVQIQRRV